MADPVTREEMYLSAIAEGSSSVPEPITREEKFLAKIAGEDVETPEPVTRKEKYYKEIIDNGGGGGGSGVLINKDISANGTYNASSDNADGYKKVVVNVPTPIVEPLTVTENGTYQEEGKAYSPVNVNVAKTNIDIGASSPVNLMNMFYDLEHGTAKTGTFTLAKTLPNTDVLLFDTQLNTVNGFAVFDTEFYQDLQVPSTAWQMWIAETSFVPYSHKNEYMYGCAAIQEKQDAGTSQLGNGFVTNLDGTVNHQYAYFTLTDGKLYARGQYNSHNQYTPFRANAVYRWVAW